MEAVALALIASIPPTIAAIGALVITIRNGKRADAAKAAAEIAATDAKAAAVLAAEANREIIATKKGVFEVGKQIDGRLTQLLAVTAESSRSAGRAEGIAAEQERLAAGGASVKAGPEPTTPGALDPDWASGPTYPTVAAPGTPET